MMSVKSLSAKQQAIASITAAAAVGDLQVLQARR